jgi:hypothetical protein
MFSMIVALALITMTTVVTTIVAMLLMGWMLGLGHAVCRAQTAADKVCGEADEATASGSVS